MTTSNNNEEKNNTIAEQHLVDATLEKMYP